MSLNKFIIKIYSITNLMVLILYRIKNVCTFLYKFSQSSDRLTPQNLIIAFFVWTEVVGCKRQMLIKEAVI